MTIDVDIDVQIDDLDVSLTIERPDADAAYVVELITPDESRLTIDERSPQEGESSPDDDALRFVRRVSADELTDSSFGTWTFDVTVTLPDTGLEIPAGGPQTSDLGEIVSATLNIELDLSSDLTGTISGVIFDDGDGDGVRIDEPGREGVTVFVDLNRDGQRNGLEEVNLSAVTDSSGGYTIADLPTPATYQVRLFPTTEQTGPVGNDVARFDFAEFSATPGGITRADREDFETGEPDQLQPLDLPGGAGDGMRWQLTNLRRSDDGHSRDFSVLFGSPTADGALGDPEPGATGFLQSPPVRLPGEASSTNSISLQFQSLVDIVGDIVGDIGTLQDSLSVSLVDLTPGGTVHELTAPDFGLDASGTFEREEFDISSFRGKEVRFRFDVQVPDGAAVNGVRGWFLDDIAVRDLESPGPQIVDLDSDDAVTGIDFGSGSASIFGAIFSDTDGDGVRDESEPGLAGVTVFVDLNDNGELDGTDEMNLSTVVAANGDYTISGVPSPATHEVRVIVTAPATQTAPLADDVARFDFAQADADNAGMLVAGPDGFLTNGRLLEHPDTSGGGTRWQLTDLRRFAPGHSHDFSALFGKLKPEGGLQNPDSGITGTLLSPRITLPSQTDASSVSLQFQSLVDVQGNDLERLVNSLTVSVVDLSNDTIQRLTGVAFGLNSSGEFELQELDISRFRSRFRGRDVQFQFDVRVPEAETDGDSDETPPFVGVRAWYLDDIAVTSVRALGASVTPEKSVSQVVHVNPAERVGGINFAVANSPRSVSGTVFVDLDFVDENNNGMHDDGEPGGTLSACESGLPDQVVFLGSQPTDAPAPEIKRFSVSLPPSPGAASTQNAGDSDDLLSVDVQLTDNFAGTLLGIQVTGQFEIRDLKQLANLREMLPDISLTSPFGRVQALSDVLGPRNLDVTTIGSGLATLDLNAQLPRDAISLLWSEPVNGPWSLQLPDLPPPPPGADDKTPFEILEEFLGVKILNLTLTLSVVEAPQETRFVVTDETGGWQFTGLRDDEMPRFGFVPNPALGAVITTPADTGDIDLTAGSVRMQDFGVFVADAQANTRERPDDLTFADRDTGITLPAGIDYIGDRDVFRLGILGDDGQRENLNGLVTLELQTKLGTLTPLNGQLTVKDSQGREVAFNDDSLFLLRGDFDARLQFNASANEQYFVEVRASESGDPFPMSPRQMTGDYMLFVSLDETVAENSDPPVAAGLIEDADSENGNIIPRGTGQNEPVYRVGNIDFAGDRDIYRFEARDKGRLQIDLEDFNSSLVTQLNVFRLTESGKVQLTQLPTAITLPDVESRLLAYPSFAVSVDIEDELFIQVSGMTTEDSLEFGNATGEYLLTLETVVEQDGNASSPIVPADGSSVRRNGSIEFDGDVDAFQFRVPEFEASPPNTSADGFIEILLEPGELSFLDGEFTIERRDPGTNKFFKLIDSGDSNSSAFRTLRVGSNIGLPGSSDQVAPLDVLRVVVRSQNQTRVAYRLTARYLAEDRTPRGESSEPININLDTELIRQSRIDFAGDRDRLDFFVPDGPATPEFLLAEILVLRVDDNDAELDSSDVNLRVKPSPDNSEMPDPIENEADDFPELFVTEVQAGVIYEIDIGFLGIESGRYEVSVLVTDISGVEDDDTASDRTVELDAGGEQSVSGRLGTAGDNDVFSLTAPASGLLTVRLSGEFDREDGGAGGGASDRDNDDGELDLVVTTGPGTPTVVANVDPRPIGRNERLLESTFLIQQGGVYFFDVASSNRTGDYDLEFELLGGSVSPDGVIEVSPDDPPDASGEIDLPGTEITNRVRATRSGRLNIQLDAFDDLVPQLRVFNVDANGTPVGNAIAERKANRTNQSFDLNVDAVAGQTLAVVVGTERPSDGEFDLSFRLAGAVADDVGNNPSTATEVSLENEIGGLSVVTLDAQIDFDSDRDVYRFTSPFTGRVGVSMIATDSLVDAGLAVVQDPETGINLDDSEELDEAIDFSNPLQQDDNSGVGLNADLDFAVQRDRTYFVQARAVNAVPGRYSIVFRPETGDDFGDSLSSADALILNSSGVISRDRNSDGEVDAASESGRPLYGFLGANDSDVFRFEATVTRQLLISTTTISDDLRTRLFVYEEDAAGNRALIAIDSTLTPGELAIDVVQGRFYFLQLDSEGSTFGRYQLVIQPVDRTRPLRVVQDANGIQSAVGQRVESIVRPGVADFFEFRSPIAGRAIVTLEAIADPNDSDSVTTLDPLLSLLDSSRNVLAVNDDTNPDPNRLDSRLEFDVDARGSFLLRAGGVGGSTGFYRLSVAIERLASLLDTPDGTETDPGEITRDAASLTLTGPANGPLTAQRNVTLRAVTSGAERDIDVFSFQAAIAGNVVVTLNGTAGASAVLDVLREDDSNELLLTSGQGSVSFAVVRGEFYSIRVTAPNGVILSGQLAVVLTAATTTQDIRFLSTSVGNATTELLGQIFTQLVSSGQDFSADELSEAVLTEFFAASGGQENLQERFLLLYVDPVDFVLESSTGDQAGFTADRGQLDQYGNTFYSGDAVTELLVIPQADAGRYSLQLEGLGQDVRGGASLVSDAGVFSTTFEFQKLTGRTVLPLNFPETAIPVTTDVAEIEGVPPFPVSVILTSILGIRAPEAGPRRPGTSYRDLFVNYLPSEVLVDALQRLPPILVNLTNDLRLLVPVDLPDWDFGLPFDSTDAEPDWLLPAVAPGLSGLTEAMSRFGEVFGELLLPIITAADEAAEDEPADESSDDADSDAAATRRRQPAIPAESDEAAPASPVPGSTEPESAEPAEKTSQVRPSRDQQAATVADNTATRDVWSRLPREPKRVADVWM